MVSYEQILLFMNIPENQVSLKILAIQMYCKLKNEQPNYSCSLAVVYNSLIYKANSTINDDKNEFVFTYMYIMIQDFFLILNSYASKTPTTHRPRMLLAGQPGQGQTTHLAPGILHNMEQLPVHVLDLPSLFAVSTKTPEESCAQVILDKIQILYLKSISWTR